ncbi:sulfite exporter TauE/SafE family protein [Streptomyces sp. NPDC021212]|uniref:sulfite exporter TauE/SafE family protein n=1 Tax=Streptomyces sp. NPDC021212 TaxID=3365118 RepID=UPI003799A98D
MFSYPALLAAGLPPTTANVTNTVLPAVGNIAVVPSSRRELTGQFDAALRIGVACAAGSAVGVVLLLLTPPGVFERVVPFLVGSASLLILGRRQATATTLQPTAGGDVTWLSVIGMFAVALYGGYLAAASGVVILALLLATRGSEGLLRSYF